MRNVVLIYCVYLFEILFLDSYLSSLIHVLPAKYQSSLSFSRYLCIECIDMNCYYISLGFTSMFLAIRSYSNILVVELNQLYYGGLLRCIALSSTDGLCSWRCLNILMFQPVIVFIGRLAVGRILNVVGSVID